MDERIVSAEAGQSGSFIRMEFAAARTLKEYIGQEKVKGQSRGFY